MNYSLFRSIKYKKISLTFLGLIFFVSGIAKCLTSEEMEKKIIIITDNDLISRYKKLQFLYALKKEADDCKVYKDSNYAKLLDRLGFYEFLVNKDYNNSISLTLESIKINSIQQTSSSKNARIKSYINLAYYYKDILQYTKSRFSCDSAIAIAENNNGSNIEIMKAKIIKAGILFFSGDYQECIEESTKGIAYALTKKDTVSYIEFLIQRSQSFLSQNRFDESLTDIESVFISTNDPYYIASGLKIKASVYEAKHLFKLANEYYVKSVNLRISTNIYRQIVNDYIDLGNFYLLSMKKNMEAKASYNKAIEYARKENNSLMLASIFTNLGNLNFTEKKYFEAAAEYGKAFETLSISKGPNLLNTPPASVLNTIGNTDLITELLSSKVMSLLELFKQTHNKIYIDASIKTALVTDSVITQIRHQQLGEQSKLYWRNKTRSFFTAAMEACFEADDKQHAFYFMEKSRSVLLNDKLNELGASAKISSADANKEEYLKTKIFGEQQKLNQLTVNTITYNDQQQVFLNLKDTLQDFIKSLETKYPAYYAYKYDDKVPSLSDLQKFLAQNKQSFIHYFTNDTVAYILSITANNAKITRLSKKDFNYQQINDFINFCSNKDLLNINYSGFAALSNKLYKTLFQPLQLPKGRIIICSDNFLLPFDALCSDAAGKNFLINDYIFSYAYSATYLLKPFTTYPAKGNFIGFAPVNFRPELDVNPLLNSSEALSRSADNYKSTLLFTNKDATKNNFIQNVGGYTVANVFSHASADSSENEPRLYMQDTTINLSELQMLNRPATKLVVLSACQTNVGKNATGEGIYSLARGFTSAGIPSIAATLWKADEDMIYEISERFNENLAQGMSKDSALQKAKIDFIKSNNKEKLLPYYWANMVLIGNTSPLELTGNSNMWWWIAAIITTFVIVIILKPGKLPGTAE